MADAHAVACGTVRDVHTEGVENGIKKKITRSQEGLAHEKGPRARPRRPGTQAKTTQALSPPSPLQVAVIGYKIVRILPDGRKVSSHSSAPVEYLPDEDVFPVHGPLEVLRAHSDAVSILAIYRKPAYYYGKKFELWLVDFDPSSERFLTRPGSSPHLIGPHECGATRIRLLKCLSS